MSIKDPTANNRTLLVLKNPKVPIKGFRNGVGKCVNLHSIMREGCGVPDFGFDQDEETVVSKERQDIAQALASLTNSKENRPILWASIAEMNDIKRLYNKLIQ